MVIQESGSCDNRLEHEKDKESDLYMYLRELKDQLVCMFNINESHSKRVKPRTETL